MDALFQIGKEIGELRGRIEALEREKCNCSKLTSGQSLARSAPVSLLEPEVAPDIRKLAAMNDRRLVPQIPVMLNGTQSVDLRELNRTDEGTQLFTPLRTTAGLVLGAFTDWDTMISESAKHTRTVIQSELRAFDEHICQQPPDNLPEQACFFLDINESSDILCLPPMRAYSNLTKVSRGFLNLSDWNDQISSVAWCRWDVSLFENINYGGRQLWLPAGCNTPNLVLLGFNDIASSIVNWGQRFSSQPVLS